MTITFQQADLIVRSAFQHAEENDFAPLTVAVLDPGGHLVSLGRQDGSGIMRPDIAVAKAWGVLGLGIPNREIANRAQAAPEFFTSIVSLAGGRILSVPGGVFVRDTSGSLLGAVGATGDSSLNDEYSAVAGIRAAGLIPETGE